MKFMTFLESQELTLDKVYDLDCLFDPDKKEETYFKGLINVNGNVSLVGEIIDHRYNHLKKLPVQFGVVKQGLFNISGNKLTTLKGSPQKVEGSYFATDNDLTSLEFSPVEVTEIYSVARNPRVTSFKGITRSARNYDLFNCKITSLLGIHKHISYAEHLNLKGNPLTEGGLGVLLIKGLVEFVYDAAPHLDIITKYLGKGKRGMIDCQTELIKAGYKEFAKL